MTCVTVPPCITKSTTVPFAPLLRPSQTSTLWISTTFAPFLRYIVLVSGVPLTLPSSSSTWGSKCLFVDNIFVACNTCNCPSKRFNCFSLYSLTVFFLGKTYKVSLGILESFSGNMRVFKSSRSSSLIIPRAIRFSNSANLASPSWRWLCVSLIGKNCSHKL